MNTVKSILVATIICSVLVPTCLADEFFYDIYLGNISLGSCPLTPSYGMSVPITMYGYFVFDEPTKELSPWPIGPLEPNMTYYWLVAVHSSYYSCPGSPSDRSAIHSFTTGDAVPVVPTTMGGLKSIFKKE